MRTFDQIRADIDHALGTNNARVLRLLASEMQALGTPKAEASAFQALGVAGRLTGEYDKALENYRRALTIHDELGNRVGVASITGNIGNVYREIGDYPAALEHARRAVAVYEEMGDRFGVALGTGNIGIVYRETGDFPAALEHYLRALAVHEELNDRIGAAKVIGNIGTVYADTGDYPAALEHYRRALERNEELGDRVGVARVTANIGTVFADTGDFLAAIDHYRRALVLEEELGNRAGVARATANIGSVYENTGDHPTALEHYRRALVMLEELGNLPGVAGITGSIISALLKLDRYDEAAELWNQQSSMLMDDPSVRSLHHAHRAALSEQGADLDATHTYLLEALSIARDAGLPAEAAQYHIRLRELAQKRNDFAGYIKHNSEYLRITEEIRGQQTTQRLTMIEADRRMESERREREKERALLYGALPQSVADRMIRGDTVNGDHFPNAAVLFADVVGFTSGSSSLDASQVVRLLETVFEAFDRICDEHAVIKVKTIGDSYMCFKGDATAEENVAALAGVALALQRISFTWPDGRPMYFRVGLHAGPATAGVIGTQRLQYDVWGDTVNVATRMESTGEAGRIHVSDTVALLLASASQHSLTLRGPVEVKGKGMITTYWLEGA